MRIAITTRVFEPEASAASFRLAALANAFVDEGHDVNVLTVLPRSADRKRSGDRVRRYRVRRLPVLRDKTGYVRGYVQYMSFDIPLFFRILFGPKYQLIVTEPPPTTGFFVRLAARLKRTPYAYYAADIWSDAAESTGASKFVVSAVRQMERFALLGARGVVSVNDKVTERVQQIAPTAHVHTVGNGVDTAIFTAVGSARANGKYLLYSGTASEWQGAEVFIDALAVLLPAAPDVRLVFLGQGSDWPKLRERASRLPAGAVEFIPTVPPEEAATWLRGAVVSLASIRPDAGYDLAFPTKVYASWACGTPVIYAGAGPVPEFMRKYRGEARLGESAAYEVEAVAEVLLRTLAEPPKLPEQEQLGEWAAQHVGLGAVALKAVQSLVKRPDEQPLVAD